MHKHAAQAEVDGLQRRLTEFALELDFVSLTEEDINAAKIRVIDTLAAAIGGFGSAPCRMARRLASEMLHPKGATIIGTRHRTTADTAAFVNAIAAREAEMNDVYMPRAGGGAHPSDVIMPLLAVAESVGADGRELLNAIVLAYEVYMSIADVADISGFDQSTLAGLGIAVGAGKLMRLPAEQLHHCISIVIVANNPLAQSRVDQLSMWKAAAAGQAGRAGVFAAKCAQAGMEGPHLPFEGRAGWCKQVCRNSFSLVHLGARPLRIRDTLIKPRASCAITISSILAAEAAAPHIPRISDIERVVVETYEFAKATVGSGENAWNPRTRETADHSIPYSVSAALMDGTVGPRQFKDDRLWNPELRAMLPKIEVIALDEFTEAYERKPREHRTRVIVDLLGGQRIVGEAGGARGDMSNPPSNSEIEAKFSSIVQEYLDEHRTRNALQLLWNIERAKNLRDIPAAFAME
jgi:2-methylcitrate dehydratase